MQKWSDRRIRNRNSSKFMHSLTGTWLEHSRLSLLKIIWFMWFWIDEMATGNWCKKNLDMSLETFVNFCSYMREICPLQVHDVFRETKIGGPGNFVCWGYGKILTFVSTRFGRQGARNMLRRRHRKQVSSNFDEGNLAAH